MTARSKRLVLALILMLWIGAEVAEGTIYGKILTKAVKRALGPQITPWKKDFKYLACFSYPTNNFGVPTSYEHPREFICDSWFCLGKERPAERDLSMAGFVAVGTGGTITLSESKMNELALEFVVPSIANVIGINLGLDWAKTVTTDLTLGPAHIRRLRPDPMYSLIADLPASSMMKRAFTDGDLVLTVLDIVVDKMTVTLQVNRALNPSLDAQLKQKAMDWVGASQSNLNVSLVQVTEGSFTLEISQPVVVCVWPKRQRRPGVFGAGGMVEETILIEPADPWSDWRNLSDPKSVVPVAP